MSWQSFYPRGNAQKKVKEFYWIIREKVCQEKENLIEKSIIKKFFSLITAS